MYRPSQISLRGTIWPMLRPVCCRASDCSGRGDPRARVIRSDLILPGLLLALLLAALILPRSHGSASSPGGLGKQAISATIFSRAW